MSLDLAAVSPLKRREIVDALRIGAVPRRGLELFAVGLEPFAKAIDDELQSAATGRGCFKAVRGDYGTGKTFFARWLEQRARHAGFATTLVQISETDTPLYRMETVYRRAVQALQTVESSEGTFRAIIEGWFFNLEEEILGAGQIDPKDPAAVAKAVGDLLEQRLASVSATQPQFAAALRRIHAARVHGEHAIGEGLIAWLMGQPNIGAEAKREAGLKGEIDDRGAAGFFRGLLEILRHTGRKGLVLVLDEVETIQRVRADSREKSLNALRQLIDDLIAGSYPGVVRADHRDTPVLRRATGGAAAGTARPAFAHRVRREPPVRQPAGRPDPTAALHVGAHDRGGAADLRDLSHDGSGADRAARGRGARSIDCRRGGGQAGRQSRRRASALPQTADRCLGSDRRAPDVRSAPRLRARGQCIRDVRRGARRRRGDP